jgi:hypothetical protein
MHEQAFALQHEGNIVQQRLEFRAPTAPSAAHQVASFDARAGPAARRPPNPAGQWNL